MRVDIMTDIETLGKGNNTTVFQIAACAFDINTGKLFTNLFNQVVNISKEDNIPIDGSTLVWWLNTDKELLTKLLNEGTVSQRELFENFNNWIVDQPNNITDVFLWGNGILFDNKLI